MISEEMLSRPPSDPEHAENYAKLYELWKQARSRLDFVAAGEKQFDEWDLRVRYQGITGQESNIARLA